MKRIDVSDLSNKDIETVQILVERIRSTKPKRKARKKDGRRRAILETLESHGPMSISDITKFLSSSFKTPGGETLTSDEVEQTLHQMAWTMKFLGIRRGRARKLWKQRKDGKPKGTPRMVWRVARIVDGRWAACDFSWNTKSSAGYEAMAIWHQSAKELDAVERDFGNDIDEEEE